MRATMKVITAASARLSATTETSSIATEKTKSVWLSGKRRFTLPSPGQKAPYSKRSNWCHSRDRHHNVSEGFATYFEVWVLIEGRTCGREQDNRLLQPRSFGI